MIACGLAGNMIVRLTDIEKVSGKPHYRVVGRLPDGTAREVRPLDLRSGRPARSGSVGIPSKVPFT